MPESSCALRAFWAFIILSVSSISVGMNRRAMVIIMASSCTGKCSFASGCRSCSMASVSTIGLVVYVSRLVPAIRQMMRTAIMTA